MLGKDELRVDEDEGKSWDEGVNCSYLQKDILQEFLVEEEVDQLPEQRLLLLLLQLHMMTLGCCRPDDDEMLPSQGIGSLRAACSIDERVSLSSSCCC